MSWAKHNPEANTEILKEAVSVKLTAAMSQNGFDDFDAKTLEMVIDTLQHQAAGGVWEAALGWAHHEIADAEGEYRRQINGGENDCGQDVAGAWQSSQAVSPVFKRAPSRSNGNQLRHLRRNTFATFSAPLAGHRDR